MKVSSDSNLNNDAHSQNVAFSGSSPCPPWQTWWAFLVSMSCLWKIGKDKAVKVDNKYFHTSDYSLSVVKVNNKKK